MTVEETLDVRPGLWIWRLSYPDWHEGAGWPEVVTSTCVESGGEVAVLDPLAPPDASEIWERLDARAPTLAVVLKPDHVRDVDLFVRRYGCRAFGPWLFERQNIPETELEPIEPGSELPGGLRALYDGRGRNETPLWLREQRTLVFADGLAGAPDGLRIWETPHIDRARVALRELLDLPFERVIVSHGEPLHDRAAFERALDLPPWRDWD
jgi:glyoxylase-like metal-dependent hydrolase (beta-lactamase superfamily II)